MLVLDENLPADQQRLLLKWRIRFRRVGVDLAAFGAEDENLLPVLRRLAYPTFCTLDRDFYRRDWVHSSYCLVWLDVQRRESAEFIRRFLRHPAFDSGSERMGVVARVHSMGVSYWRAPRAALLSASWLSRS